MGRDITILEIQEIMQKHDKSNDGVIQFEEFKLMLLEDEGNQDMSTKNNNNFCAPDNFVMSKQKSMRKKNIAQRV